MTRLHLFLIGLALSLGLGWYSYSQHVEVVRLRAENQSLMEAQKRAVEREKRDRAVLVARQAKIVSQGRKLAEAQEALSEALQRNKSWSDTDVPDEVQKALSERSDKP
jgi:hypothetical protein